MDNNKPESFINFAGQDWSLLKMYLDKKLDTKISLLVGESEHDESNKIRGAISIIKEILALEKAATKGR